MPTLIPGPDPACDPLCSLALVPCPVPTDALALAPEFPVESSLAAEISVPPFINPVPACPAPWFSLTELVADSEAQLRVVDPDCEFVD